MPDTPWLMTQSWNDLLFAHWRVDVAQMRRAVPDVFDLDLFDGEAWLGIVPFYMTNVGIRNVTLGSLAVGIPGTQRSDICSSRRTARRATSSVLMPVDGSPSRGPGPCSTCRTTLRA